MGVYSDGPIVVNWLTGLQSQEYIVHYNFSEKCVFLSLKGGMDLQGHSLPDKVPMKKYKLSKCDMN